MRLALLEQLPAFAAVYSMMPWHVAGGPEHLTFREIPVFQRQFKNFGATREGA